MKKIALAGLLSALFAAPAMAADSGVYAGLNVGSGSINTTGAGWSSSSATVVGGVLGYKMDTNLSIEGQYTGAGKATDIAGGSVKVDALSVSVVGSLPMSESLSLYGKLGIANTKTTATAAYGTGSSKTGLTGGIGLQYNVNESTGLRLGYDRYTAQTTGARGQSFSTGVLYAGGVVSF